MRRKLIPLLFFALLPFVKAGAQEVVELKQVRTDSLVSFLRTACGQKVYYAGDESDRTLLTVKAPDDKFFETAISELSAKGYSISRYGDGWYVLPGRGLAVSLPIGYFSDGTRKEGGDDLLKFVEDRGEVANFRNKVYEIGDKTNRRTGGTGNVRGYVRNIADGEPLSGVAVIAQSTGAYSLTDAYGSYNISLPVGENTLVFSGYSMDDTVVKLLVYGDGELDIPMSEKVISLEGAVVSGDRVSQHIVTRMGVERISPNIVKTIPAAFGESDILRAMLALPGVATVGEAASGFNVRGGSSDQNLILFNDGVIYNPSHMFGILSTFNTDVVSTAELYKSSIPAEYGGRISSVLDIRTRTGNAKKIKGSLGLGLLTSKLELEGPIGSENTTFILGARTTYSNWILGLLPANSGYAGGRADFGDANFALTHKFGEKNTVQASAYLSADQFAFSGDTTFRYSNASATLKWRHTIDSKSEMTVSGGYDRYRNSMDEFENAYNAYTYSTVISQARAKAAFKTVLSDAHTLSYGADGVLYILNPGQKVPYSDDSFLVPVYLPVQRGLQSSLYASDEWKAGRTLSFEAGARLSSYAVLGDSTAFYLNPEVRLSGKYSPLPGLSFKAGFNTMTQYIHLISNSASISPMDSWQMCTSRIRPQTGYQAAAGAYWTLPDGKTDISAEVYTKRVWNCLDYKSGAVLTMNPNLADDLVETTMKAWRAELMVRKQVGKLTGWISYTYSRSMLRETLDRGIETINGGQWYNAPHDKPHDLKVVGNYKLTHRFSLSCNLDYSSGRPVTIPIGKYVYGGGYRLAYSARNGYRIPDYFRMDLALIVEPSHYLKKLTHLSMTLGCYNVTGRKNAYSIFYTTDGGTGVKGYMVSVFATQIPYVSLNMKF